MDYSSSFSQPPDPPPQEKMTMESQEPIWDSNPHHQVIPGVYQGNLAGSCQPNYAHQQQFGMHFENSPTHLTHPIPLVPDAEPDMIKKAQSSQAVMDTNPFQPFSQPCDKSKTNPFVYSQNDPIMQSGFSSAEISSTLPEIIYTQDWDASNNSGINGGQDNIPTDFQLTDEIEASGQSSRKPRHDSELSEASSGDMFSSSYTDTVTSADFLITKSKSDDEDETRIERDDKESFYCNDGYQTYSSSEALTEEEEMSKNDLKDNVESDEKENMPLLNKDEGVEDSQKIMQQEKDSDLCDCVTNIEDYVHHHLMPISENEVISLEIEEIKPIASSASVPPSPQIPRSAYAKITNNLTVADESFLFHSQTSLSVPDAGKGGLRAGTMNNLHERSSFLNLTDISKMGKACQRALVHLKDDLTFGSLASLNKMVGRDLKIPSNQDSLLDESEEFKIIPSTKHKRNLIALSLCITLLFISLGAVRNLQSSLNQEGGVGIMSIALSFVGYMVGSIISVSAVQNFQPRTCIIVNLVPNLLYVGANLYPKMWLIAPMSLIQGMSMAICWNAMSTYVTFLSRGQAKKKNIDFEAVSCSYFGIFCLIYQSYVVVGNLIASLVLMVGSGPENTLLNNTLSANNTLVYNMTNLTVPSTSTKESQDLTEFETAPLLPVDVGVPIFSSSLPANTTLNDVSHLQMCGAQFCHHFELEGGGLNIPDATKFTLFGIYIGCIIVSILIAIFLLEPLNPRLFNFTTSPVARVKKQMISLAKFSYEPKFLLLLPLLMYSFMQLAFISAEMTMSYITCPLGVHMVGYTMICFGLCGSFSSYLNGLFSKRIGRIPLVLIASGSNIGVLIFMASWHPTLDSLVPYFAITGLWGISDGIWVGQVNSLMGIIFPDKYEEAYAGLRVGQGLGVALSLSYSSYLCMAYKIYIMGGFCVISVAAYLVMERVHTRDRKQEIVVIRQTTV